MDLNREWQNFFINLFDRVGGTEAPTNNDLVEKSGSISQLEIRSHSDLQDLDSDDHSIYIKGMAGTGIFGSTSGTTITLEGVLSTDDYKVCIQPTCADPSNVGIISVVGKTTTSFMVVNTGVDSSSSFDWILAMR